MKHALVTGGAGFIGSHLVRRLVEKRVAVRVLDNLYSGSRDNLAGIESQIEFIEGDLRSADTCRNACREMEVVFHLAALVSVPQSVQDPIESDAINSGGVLNLLMAARENQTRRFVFSSSAAVYGDTQVIPTPEDVLPAPMSPYGVQKLTGEHYARNFTHLYRLETVCLRYFNVYGPRQNPHSQYSAVVPKFLTRLLSGQLPIVYGTGEQTRDFCFVEDVVSANLLAAETVNPDAFGQVFNIAGGVRVSLNTLLQQMQEALGQPVQPCYEPQRVADILHSGADISRARGVLGFHPTVDLPEGLRRTIDFYRGQGSGVSGQRNPD